ncbi:MAG TPA: hypothetical protein VIM34_09910 [Burkholderiaceae bacterium]
MAPSNRPAWARFTDDDRAALTAQFGLTDPQVFWLERGLRSIADHVRQKPRSNEVGDELKGLAQELAQARDKPAKRSAAIAAAQKRLRRWKAGVRLVNGLAHQAEAFAHIGVAYHVVPGPSIELHDDESPFVQLVDVIAARLGLTDDGPATAALITFAANVAERAVQDRPTTQRRPSIASGEAISMIVAALNRPEDDESKRVAQRLAPVWSDAHPRNATDEQEGRDFCALARLVFRRVTGRDTASVARSIRDYLEQSPKRRAIGRPRSAARDF